MSKASNDGIDVPQSLRDQILNSEDRKTKMVEVPEWGVTILLVGLSGTARGKWMQYVNDHDDPTLASPCLLVYAMYDPLTNEALFTERDITTLNGKAGDVLDRLAKDAMEISGLKPGEEDTMVDSFPGEDGNTESSS